MRLLLGVRAQPSSSGLDRDDEGTLVRAGSLELESVDLEKFPSLLVQWSVEI